MVAAGRDHAALAHLDALPEPEKGERRVRLLRADVLRHLDRTDEARALYESLRTADFEALALRGLGLISVQAGDLDTALVRLREAAELRPTDPQIRNDLGYALILAGRPDEAKGELLTALDLDPQNRRSAVNLVLVLLSVGDERAALSISTQNSVAPDRLNSLREKARAIAAASAAAPPRDLPAPIDPQLDPEDSR